MGLRAILTLAEDRDSSREAQGPFAHDPFGARCHCLGSEPQAPTSGRSTIQ